MCCCGCHLLLISEASRQSRADAAADAAGAIDGGAVADRTREASIRLAASAGGRLARLLRWLGGAVR